MDNGKWSSDPKCEEHARWLGTSLEPCVRRFSSRLFLSSVLCGGCNLKALITVDSKSFHAMPDASCLSNEAYLQITYFRRENSNWKFRYVSGGLLVIQRVRWLGIMHCAAASVITSLAILFWGNFGGHQVSFQGLFEPLLKQKIYVYFSILTYQTVVLSNTK